MRRRRRRVRWPSPMQESSPVLPPVGGLANGASIPLSLYSSFRTAKQKQKREDKQTAIAKKMKTQSAVPQVPWSQVRENVKKAWQDMQICADFFTFLLCGGASAAVSPCASLERSVGAPDHSQPALHSSMWAPPARLQTDPVASAAGLPARPRTYCGLGALWFGGESCHQRHFPPGRVPFVTYASHLNDNRWGTRRISPDANCPRQRESATSHHATTQRIKTHGWTQRQRDKTHI
eukprot:gene3760-biopygen6776